jgi:hypothetical protein
MIKVFALGLLLGLFAVSTPLIADPGGMDVQGIANSYHNVFSDIVGIESQALRPASGAFDATSVSKFIKSAVTLVAGGVGALLGVTLLALMGYGLVTLFGDIKRRQEFEMPAASTFAKRTKSPLLKMRAAS